MLRFHDDHHPLSRPLPLHLAKLAQKDVLRLAPAPAPAAEPHSEKPPATRYRPLHSSPGAVERHRVVSGRPRKARIPVSFGLVEAPQVDELDVAVANCGLSQVVGEACAAKAHEACLIGRGAASKRPYQSCGWEGIGHCGTVPASTGLPP